MKPPNASPMNPSRIQPASNPGTAIGNTERRPRTGYGCIQHSQDLNHRKRHRRNVAPHRLPAMQSTAPSYPQRWINRRCLLPAALLSGYTQHNWKSRRCKEYLAGFAYEAGSRHTSRRAYRNGSAAILVSLVDGSNQSSVRSGNTLPPIMIELVRRLHRGPRRRRLTIAYRDLIPR